MIWHDFDPEDWNLRPIPHDDRYVLVRLHSQVPVAMPDPVAVGYLRCRPGKGNTPSFVVPGLGGSVKAWCDCLPPDFEMPQPRKE